MIENIWRFEIEKFSLDLNETHILEMYQKIIFLMIDPEIEIDKKNFLMMDSEIEIF